MPGRQSTGPLTSKKQKTSKRKAKRSQDALAIAEHQAPVPSKIRRNRLGESEPEHQKRKRLPHDEGDLDSEDDGKHAKRRKAGDKDRYGNEIERGSDNSGNEWTVGQIDDDDDSEIDSDEAMAESDNEGANIKGSISYSTRNRHDPRAIIAGEIGNEIPEVDTNEDASEGVSDEEDDSLGDEAVDLAAVLDENDDGEGLPQRLQSQDHSGDEESAIESDEDANTKATSVVDDDSTLSYSGDEDGAEDSAKLASLHALVSTMNEQNQASNRAKAPIDAQESTTPSEFGLASRRKLTVADLAPSVTDPNIRKSLKLLANNDTKTSSKRGGIPKKLDVPLPKRQQDRLDRGAAYEKSKETLDRWIETVKHNRRAEHLSFPLRDPKAATAQGSKRLLPPSHSQPLTDLENTIQNIMQESGLTEPNGKSEEDKLQAFEELKTYKMPLEEVQARRAELRKARELLFREEIRAKRIKKIKSKTYRKVHRKERERNSQQEKDALAAAGVDDSESEQERNDRRRAEERMGARHRESKWAKGVKASGRSKWDDDARGGVTEMARRGDELRRRIEGKDVREDEYGINASSSEDDDDGSDLGDGDNQRDLERVGLLAQSDDQVKVGARGSKLASMDFMKNAESARKARNEADLENLRRDLEGEETPDEADADADAEGPGRMIFGPSKSNAPDSRAPRLESRNQFEEREDSDLEDGQDPGKVEDEVEIVVDGAKTQSAAEPISKPSLKDRQKRSHQTSKESFVEVNENPWLMPSKKGSNVGKKRTKEPDAAPIISNALPTEAADETPSKSAPRSTLKGARKAEQARESSQTTTPNRVIENNDNEEDDNNDDNGSDTEALPFVLRNQDLVRRAFAGDAVVASFTAEKNTTIADEDSKTISTTLPGWGTWVGPGVSKKAQRRNKNNNTTTTLPGIPPSKRQDAKLDRVIINEKRVKKNGKYLASSLPHPFESRQQYERSLRMPVGPEFATKLAFQDATKPRVLVKQGIIGAMARPMV